MQGGYIEAILFRGSANFSDEVFSITRFRLPRCHATTSLLLLSVSM